MDKEEKLKWIIEKAVVNGYELTNLRNWWDIIDYDEQDAIIFDHNFAKAYFGEGEKTYIDGYGRQHFDYENCDPMRSDVSLWQYHIQQLALTPPEGRIDYLYDFLKP